MDEIPEAWTAGIGLPVRGYIELHGPHPFRDVEWIEINPIVVEHIGRLVKPRYYTYLEDIISFLQSEGLAYSIVAGAVRIPFLEFSK
jgi:hypothetical protein